MDFLLSHQKLTDDQIDIRDIYNLHDKQLSYGNHIPLIIRVQHARLVSNNVGA